MTKLMMRQSAPYPHALAELVLTCRYRPGWRVDLADMIRDHVDPADDSSDELAGGLTLTITTHGYDSRNTDSGQNYRVRHLFIVPAATYTPDSWRRWLFERFVEVELHEAMEFFVLRHETEGGYTLMDGSQADHYDERPYAPNHGPGENPYVVHDATTAVARRTTFRGVAP